MTNEVLSVWYEELNKNFSLCCSSIEREHNYINKPLPFRALHMGKKNDEYFLDQVNNKISVY